MNSLGAFPFVDRFRGKAKRLSWWIHETSVGFDTLGTLTADVPALFSACESIWLGSPLCFRLAGRYASPDKLHRVLYGCEDRGLSHRPQHANGEAAAALFRGYASRDDPMPIVMTEGLMQSKVCLCSSVIGHAQLLEDGTEGSIFASESAQQLADKMAWIIANRDELTAVGAAGRAVYERHFLVSDFVGNVGTLLEQCA